MVLEDDFDPNAERVYAQKKARASYDGWITWLAKQEGKSEEALVKSVLLSTARKLTERKREAWVQAAAKKTRIMSDCARDKIAPPHNYWEEEYKTLAHYQEAERVLAAIEAET